MICGKPFLPRTRLQKTCSVMCSYKLICIRSKEFRKKKTKTKPTVTRICKVCGKEFTVTHGRQQTCSIECSMENRYETARRCRQKRRGDALKDQRRTCEICGKEFTPRVSRQKLCSRECAKEKAKTYRQEYARKRAAAEREELENLKTELAGLKGSLAVAQDELRRVREDRERLEKALAKARETRSAAPAVKKKKYPIPEGMRACHDCGKPTTDYRCPECWKKRRQAEETW